MLLLSLLAFALLAGMAVAPTQNFVNQGQYYESWITYALDNNYPTGGYPIPLPSNFALQIACLVPFSVKGGNFVADWDRTTGNLRILSDPGTGLAEVVNGTSLVGVTVDCLVYGR